MKLQINYKHLAAPAISGHIRPYRDTYTFRYRINTPYPVCSAWRVRDWHTI